CWAGGCAAGETRTQFPCPSLGVVDGTLTQNRFSKAGFFAVNRDFGSSKSEAKRQRAAWSRPRRPTPARGLRGWRVGRGGRERRKHQQDPDPSDLTMRGFAGRAWELPEIRKRSRWVWEASE
ncbi:unnamed protein product, partial [Gulo gulo]